MAATYGTAGRLTAAGRLLASGREAAARSRLGREARDFADLVADGLFYALPARFAPSPPAAPRIALVVDFDQLRVAMLDGDGSVRDLSPPIPLEAAEADVLARALRDADGAVGGIGLLLADGCCLTHALRLPPAPTRLIDALVANAAAERSAFGEGEGLYAWSLRGRDRDGLSVETCAVDRGLVEPVLERLRSVGLAPRAVGRLAPDARRAEWLSPPAWAGLAAPSPWSALRGLRGLLRHAGSFAAIVLAAALLNVSYATFARDRLGEEAERALAGARAGAALRADRARLDAARAAGLARVALLDEIAARLPDDAWLKSARLGAGEAEMSVVAGSASNVLGALAGTPGLRDLGFRGSVTQDAATRRDRFRLGATTEAASARAAPPARWGARSSARWSTSGEGP